MNRRWKVSCLLLLAIAATCVASHVASSQSKAISTEELTRRADIVAVGKVSSQRSEWNSDRTRIITHVTVAIDQYLKGNQGQGTLTVTVPGGEVGGVGEVYSHAAKFQNNEAVVVFAERDQRGALRVTAGEQGKLTITTEKVTGKRLVGDAQLLEVFTSRVKSAAHREQ